MENLTEMLKGSLEGCVLEIISRRETYGYEITPAWVYRSCGRYGVYHPTIREEKKLVNIEKKPSDMGPPRKFYSLNEEAARSLNCFGKNGILYRQN